METYKCDLVNIMFLASECEIVISHYIYISYKSHIKPRVSYYKMNHPHKIDYYQFPEVKKPVLLSYDPPSGTILEEDARDLDWWSDSDDENA